MWSTKTNSSEHLMYLKKHVNSQIQILAVCDEDLLGKTFHEDGKKLEITERFYLGEQATKETVLKALQESKNSNLVGKETIKLALDTGLISQDAVLNIQGIPYTLIFEL